MYRNNNIELKIVVLGSAGVGKTCVIHRFSDGVFISNTLSTIGAGFYPHTVQIDQTTINMTLWDTAGEERFRSVTPTLLRGANGLVLIYDCTNIESFKELKIYLDMFIKTANVNMDTQLPVLLLGNKADLEIPKIPDEMIKSWAENNNISHVFQVSAKTGDGIEESFNDFLSDFVNQAPPPTDPTLIHINIPQEQQGSKSCC